MLLKAILAQAENSYRTGDSNTAAAQADSVLPIAQEVTTAAQNAKQTASVSGQNAFWSTIAFTVIGAFVFVLALFLVWRWFKRSYIKQFIRSKTRGNQPMKLEGYKTCFCCSRLNWCFAHRYSCAWQPFVFLSGEQFSELYLLGPNQMAENYPSNIAVGQNYSSLRGCRKSLGSSAYYVLYVKLIIKLIFTE